MTGAAALLLVLGAAATAPPELSGRFVVEPESAAIGQPTTWTLVVEHSPGRVELVATPFADDRSWVVLAGPEVSSERAGAVDRTRFRWTVLSLESGRREVAPVEVRIAGGESVTVGGGALEVGPELAPDEDTPRPLADFHEVHQRVGPLAPWHLGLVVLVLVAALVAWRRLRRRRSAPAPEPGGLERLAELRSAVEAAEGERARALAYELSALVRERVDRARGVDDAGRTDDEWLGRVDAEPELAAVAADLRVLLGACAEVKYGGRVPTRFALGELVGRAERVLGAVEGEPGRRAA